MKWFMLCGLLTFGASVLADVIDVPGDQPTIQMGIDATSSGGQTFPDSGGWVSLEPGSPYGSFGEYISCDKSIQFRLRISNFTGGDVSGLSNGFRVYSPDGALWQPLTGMWNPLVDWFIWWDGGVFVSYFSATGSGADTVGFGCFGLLGGYPNGRSDVAFLINTRVECDQIGKTICLDSTWYPPSNPWLWSTTGGVVYPAWDGPHCWTISSCCRGLRGNVDFSPDGQTNVADIIALIDYLFQGGPPPYCEEEADVDGSGQWDVSDVVYLVAYLFQGGPPPLPCS